MSLACTDLLTSQCFCKSNVPVCHLRSDSCDVESLVVSFAAAAGSSPSCFGSLLLLPWSCDVSMFLSLLSGLLLSLGMKLDAPPLVFASGFFSSPDVTPTESVSPLLQLHPHTYIAVCVTRKSGAEGILVQPSPAQMTPRQSKTALARLATHRCLARDWPLTGV